MRLALTVLFLSTIALAGCGKPDGKPDPTKPIPWLQKPKDPKAIAAAVELAGARVNATARHRALACGGEARCDLRRVTQRR